MTVDELKILLDEYDGDMPVYFGDNKGMSEVFVLSTANRIRDEHYHDMWVLLLRSKLSC